MAELTFAKINELLKVDLEAGKLYWLPRAEYLFTTDKQTAAHNCKIWNGRFAGSEAFAVLGNNGYYSGSIFRKKYLAHRVIWLLYTGEWPLEEIDHINGDRRDNRISNLRPVSHTENARNQRLNKKNTTGAIGVGFYKKTGKWEASIKIGGRKSHLGLFDDFDSALLARKVAEAKYGFHKNHGHA